MIYSVLVDAVVVAHFLFVMFAAFGGVMVFFRFVIAWIHLPSLMLLFMFQFTNWIFPLAPVEIWLRKYAFECGRSGGVLEHYLLPIIYTQGANEDMKIVLGVMVILFNLIVYCKTISRKLYG